MKIQMKDRYTTGERMRIDASGNLGFGSAPIRQEGSVVSYDDSLLVQNEYSALKATSIDHAVSVDIDTDTITLTEEEQND